MLGGARELIGLPEGANETAAHRRLAKTAVVLGVPRLCSVNGARSRDRPALLRVNPEWVGLPIADFVSGPALENAVNGLRTVRLVQMYRGLFG